MPNLYIILLLSTALINSILAVYALRFLKSPGTLAYCILLTAIGVYSFGYAFELQSTNLQQVIFWLRIEYLGISFLPALFYIMSAQYTGNTKLLKPGLVILFFLLSLVTLVLQTTNFGNLYYREMKLSYEASFPVADFTMGTWYWIHQIYLNLMILFCILLYITMIRSTKGTSRKRAYIMLFSIVLPWIFYLVYLIGKSPFHIDLSPFSFSLVGILAALGIFRYNLLAFVPVALQHVFDSMTDGVIIIDTKKRIVSFNPSASIILPELSTISTDDSADDVFISWFNLSNLIDGFESDIEITSHGSLKYYHLRIVAVYTDYKNLVGWVIVFTNITERKLKEKSLLDIERKLMELNDTKDKLMAIIGHDLRNSFHLIINMSEMILENIAKDNKQVALRQGKVIYDTAVSTFNLLQNLLDWALLQQKGKPFNPYHLNLNSLIDSELTNLKTLADQKELIINRTCNSQLTVYADEEMLKTVIRNLISNAIKYTNKGGQIDIRATSVKGLLSIEIRDNGIGMSENEQAGLLKADNYFTRKGTALENGTGLGLKLCKEFVSLHGGELWVNSIQGKGSTFVFTIPQ